MTAPRRIRELPLWKKMVFALLPAALLVALLAGAEVLLRVVDPVPPEPFVHEVTFDGVTWYETNRAWLRRYFPAGSPMVPEFKTVLFRKEKTPRTFRVICLGGSTMYGTPYDMNATIPGILRRQLRHRYPGLEWEVINLGASAINSNVVRDLSGELLMFDPDLIVVYMGHNEYYGPDGVGASFAEKLIPALTPVKYRLRELRLMRKAEEWLVGTAAGGKDPAGLMQQVSGGHHVRYGSAESDRILAHFEDNLDAILSVFADAGVPVVLSDVASNLMFPPFAGDSLIGGMAAGDFIRVMEEENRAGRHDAMLERVSRLDPAGAQDPHAAYWKGVALRHLGRVPEAVAALEAARDADLLKFRAPGAVNAILHRVAEQRGVLCVRADSLLRGASPDGIPGDALFWEHLHPTPAGYYTIAGGILDAITRSGLIPTPAATAVPLPFSFDSLHICWLDLAYGDVSIAHLTGRWPFDRYQREPLVLRGADPLQVQIALEVHGRRVQWNEACYRSATLFWRTGRLEDALTTYRAMLEEYPYSFYTNYLAGSLLNVMGRTEEAAVFMRTSIRSNPGYLPARLDMGLLEVNAGRFGEGEALLLQVVREAGPAPEEQRMKANALYGLGAAAANQGDLPKAMEAIGQALAIAPGYPDALRLRAAISGRAAVR